MMEIESDEKTAREGIRPRYFGKWKCGSVSQSYSENRSVENPYDDDHIHPAMLSLTIHSS